MRSIETVLIIVVVLSVYCNAQPIWPEEKKALIDLYNATQGAGWQNKWNLSTDPCVDSWHGVRCNNGHVYSLVLQKNNLRGTIPETIANLQSLQFLFLSSNQLTGTIPESFSTVTSMLQVGLDFNALSGSVPDMSRMVFLQNIFFQNNRLSGELPWLGSLRNLIYAYFSFNGFTGQLTEATGNLVQLQQFGIDNNQFYGSIPKGFGTQQNFLQSFFAQNNRLNDTFPSLLCNTPNCDASGNAFACPYQPNCCRIARCV